jgi:NAD(P)-dependent dehydrogenase (short-subunit alcohol dehydrogenase family)/rhamnose utilization protein RhaD (predicted bifunctional aldolase and dehydrogenase)
VDKALADLIRISNATGKDSSLVQGGGGNTSVKTADGKYMYIKASGTALKDMNSRAGWRKMKLGAVLDVIKDKQLARMKASRREPEVVNRLLLACEDNVTGDARPSVEAHLHALLDKCVIHLHPLVIAAYANARGGKSHLLKLFEGERWPPLWIDYTDPGFKLAKRISRLVEDYQEQYRRKPSVLILEKHGLIVTAATADSALRLVRRVIRICGDNLKLLKPRKAKPAVHKNIIAAKLAIRKGLFDATGQYFPVDYFLLTEPVAAFMARKDEAKLLAVEALNPDELIYANGPALWLDKCSPQVVTRKIKSLLSRGRKSSAAFLVEGLGLFVAADKKIAPTIAEITTGSLFARLQAGAFGGVKGLTKREQDFISNWESEAFRRNLASGQGQGVLKNRIAVVTGAGSGLGRSIVVGLARAGAMVAMADVDSKAAKQTGQIINKEGPQAQTLAIACDVTSETEVARAFEAVVDQWGGLDILVNAAGIAPAYPLVDMPVDKWRRAVEINLTGYFMMAREAARILIRQGMGGNIINVSSKSGLEASKDNTAYTATKAGEIHMARGWAMELGQHGIRVNSVAPGNVFERSQIWNPQYMKVCARKHGIRPEEVIPYYVNRTALKREITGQDVAHAVVFLCSDRARTITGQTIVPDSGQVMVR